MKILRLIVILLIGSTLLSAEESNIFSKHGQFLFSGMGMGIGSFKDIGTSPLTYNGVSGMMPFGFLQDRPKYNFEFNTNFSYLGSIATKYYMLHYFSGKMNISYLRTIPVFSNSKLNFQAGGSISAGMTGTFNDSYQNAMLNIDYYTSLFVSSGITYKFISPEKDFKISFMKFHIPHRKLAAHFRLDLPLILFNGRPNFPYLRESDLDIFDRHYFLGGFQIKSNLGIKCFLKNGNAFELSYVWTMLTTGSKDLYLLETASHNLLMSFYFKLD